MKKILSLLTLLISVLSFGQEIKIKKGVIAIDGVEIAKVNNKKRIYTISTLTEQPKFSVEMKIFKLLDGTNVYYCELIDIATNKKNEILDEGKSQSLSFEKNLVAALVDGKYKFLTAQGINESLLNTFFNESGQEGSLMKDFEKKNNSIKEEFEAENENLKTKNILIAKDGGIYSGNNLIGTISKIDEKDAQGFSVFRYQISNKNGNVVANWYYATRINPITEKLDKEFLITTDNKSFYKIPYDTMLSPRFGSDFSKDGNVKRMIAKLLSKGHL